MVWWICKDSSTFLMVEEMKFKRSNITIGACPIVHRIKIWKEKSMRRVVQKGVRGRKKNEKEKDIEQRRPSL